MKLAAAIVLLLQVGSQQPYIETFEVRLHNLDVVVTHSDGRAVAGLAKDDFIILEDGKLQEITADYDTLARAMKQAMDDSHSRADTQAQNELRFLEQQLGYARSGPLGRKELHQVRRMYTDMVRRRVEQRLGQMRALIAALSAYEGKKVLVLLTASLSAQPGREAHDPAELFEGMNTDDGRGLTPEYADLTPRIAELGRTAAANGVTIYALQPDVQMDLMTSSSVQTRAGTRGLPSRIFTDSLTNTQETLQSLAVASLVYPRAMNELGVRALAGTLTKDRNLFTVPVETLIPMDKLTFLPSGEGNYRAAFTVTFAAAGERNDFSAGQERQQRVEITEEQHRALAGRLFHYSTKMVVAPGRVKIAVGVLDLTSKLSGFHTLEVDAR